MHTVMGRVLVSSMCATVALAVICASLPATAQTATLRMVSAANTLLSLLDAQQRQTVMFAFDDAQQRARWSNLPITIDVCFVNTPPVSQLFPWERRRLACFRSGLEARAPRQPFTGKGLVK